MHLNEIISVIFYISCSIYFFYALLVLSYNVKSLMHWLFFCCCIDMSLWALAFSIGNLAADYESALLWRRIASVGWGSMFSYFLHYILLLTENKLLKKKWIYVLLYVPALLNIFLYGIYTNTAVQSYNLVQTYFGWINISGNTFLDWYYNIYYFGFTLIGIFFLFRWGVTSKDIIKKKQSIIIVVSYIVAVILGTFTEYIINYLFNTKVPQLATVIILLPVSAMFYCITRYNFMRTEPKNDEIKPNQILSEFTKLRLYLYLSMTYVIAGFVNFGIQFFSKREQVGDILVFSSIILGLGVLAVAIQNLKIEQKYKQLFVNTIYVLSIPIMGLKYINVSGVYSWVVPVILMLIAIALNQKCMIYIIWFVTYATLIWIWIKLPFVDITFSHADHISRIIILTIIVWFVFYINRTYVEIINVNKEKVRIEKLLNRISNLFLTINENNVDEIINEGIRLCKEHFKIDFIGLSFITKGMEIDSDYQWYANSTAKSEKPFRIGKLQDFILEVYPENLSLEGSLFTSDPKLSVENKFIVRLLEDMGMKSLVIRPMRAQNETIGFLCMGSAKRIMFWQDEQKNIVSLMVHLVTEIWVKLQAERELLFQAKYDSLTKLPNRNMFIQELNKEINRIREIDKILSVIFIDIDSFKSVNDSLGHNIGDSILSQVGNSLRDCVRQTDFMARFGGDEFIIMLPQITNMEDIQIIAESIKNSFKKTFKINNQEFHISASMGISVYPNDGIDSDTLIKNADLAMYKSKELGGDQFTFCTEDIKAETIRKIKLLEDLHRVLERDELEIYYQPQVSARSKKVVGYEALLRWFHPELGIISPNLFIPLAEQNGLIDCIGDWVLRTACLQCKSYQLQGLSDIRVAVNVSIVQLRNPDFINRVAQILEIIQLEACYLEIEITESTAINEEYQIIEIFTKLKKLGVSLSIDDFGTEYSSLSRLCDMPVDYVKLDIQFVSGIGQSEKNNAIISGIIELAHKIGLKVIAEGVETEAQCDFLIKNHIDAIQGFYFYRPLPQKELEDILFQII